MLSSLKAYLAIAVAAVLSIMYAVFKSTKRENEVLRTINKTQAESLHIVEVTDKVTTIKHKEHIEQIASIEASVRATKEKVKNETTTNSDTLDPKFIRLLNKNRD